MKKMLQEMENPIPHNKSLRAEQGFGANIQRRIRRQGHTAKTASAERQIGAAYLEISGHSSPVFQEAD